MVVCALFGTAPAVQHGHVAPLHLRSVGNSDRSFPKIAPVLSVRGESHFFHEHRRQTAEIEVDAAVNYSRTLPVDQMQTGLTLSPLCLRSTGARIVCVWVVVLCVFTAQASGQAKRSAATMISYPVGGVCGLCARRSCGLAMRWERGCRERS